MIYKVTLNGKLYEVEVEKVAQTSPISSPVAPPKAVPVAPSNAAPAAAPAAAPVAAAEGEVIFAPLPGTVLEIKVAAGQAVTRGQLLLTIEAMKMENDILAPRDCTVSQIVCEKGGNVDTGAPLIVLA